MPFAKYAAAQVASASIVGAVTDPSGAVVPGAKVTATNLATGLSYTGTPSNSGEFNIPELPAGHYKVVVEASGFNSWTIPDAEVTVGQILRTAPQLTVGGAQQSVEVNATGVALQTDSGTIGASIAPVQWDNLPMIGRNFISLAATTPGNSSYVGAQTGSFAGNTPDDRRRSATINVNGRTGSENDFVLDGLDDNERFVATIIVKPSMEGISEMNVVSNSFSAELSRTSGAAVVLVTKGGGNQIHGEIFEYIRNEAADARPQNLAPSAPTPPYKQHNFGGSIGGPIRKNKAFYFGDFETYLQNQGAALLATVPTAAMRTGNFAGVNRIYDPNQNMSMNGQTTRPEFQNDQIPAGEINPLALRLVNMFPLPNVPGAGLSNNYERNGSTTQTDYTVDTRGDYRFSEANSFFMRYNYDHVVTTIPHVFPTTADGFNPLGGQLSTIGPGQPGTATQAIHGVGLNDTQVFTPQLVMNVRVGYNRYANHALPAGYGTYPANQLGLPGINLDAISSGFPDFAFTNFTGFGDGEYTPTFNTNNVFTGGGSVQWQRGKHTLKFGAELTKRYDQDAQSVEPKVAYQFTPDLTTNLTYAGASTSPSEVAGTGNAIATFLLGFPSVTQRQRLLTIPTYEWVESGMYVQDDYRFSNQLTLNLGVRWDYYSPASEQQNRISNFDFTRLAQITPGQFGYGNTVGVQKQWTNVGPHIGFAYQATPKTVVRGGFGVNYTPLMMGTPGAFRNPPFVSSFTITTSTVTPSNRVTDPVPALVANSQTNLSGPIWAVAMNYKLPYVEQFNFAVQQELPAHFLLTSAFVGSLGKQQSGTNSAVNLDGAAPGPAPVLQRQVYYAQLPNLTNINTVINHFASSFLGLETTLETRSWHGMTLNMNHTWSHAIDDQPYRYTAFNVRTSLDENSPADTRNRLNATWVWDLPYHSRDGWYTAFLRNWQINALGLFQTGLPVSITESQDPTNSGTASGSAKVPNQIGSFRVANPSIAQWFNAGAFQVQPAYTWGNGGINQVFTPGNWDVDLAVHREFQFERLTAQFRLESFDFTNSRTPGAPISTLGAPGFGTINTFNNNRRLQAALKLMF